MFSAPYSPCPKTGAFFMKKLTAIFLSFLLLAAMFGCSAGNTDDTGITGNGAEISASSSSEKKEDAQEKETDNESPTTAQKSENDSSDKNTDKDNGDTSQTNSNSNKTKDSESTADSNKKTNKITTKKSTGQKSTTTSTTSSTITCTVTVECKSILDNMDKLKAGHDEYVPANGYIINTCSVTVKNGSSVYDAVKKACDSHNIYLNAVNSSYGTYVAGFNNIDEKDCGSQSGWLYSVNGVSPSKSCGKYVLSNGDSVVFTYTCT